MRPLGVVARLTAGHSASTRRSTGSSGSSIDPAGAQLQRDGSLAAANRATVRRLIPNRAAISRRDAPLTSTALTQPTPARCAPPLAPLTRASTRERKVDHAPPAGARRRSARTGCSKGPTPDEKPWFSTRTWLAFRQVELDRFSSASKATASPTLHARRRRAVALRSLTLARRALARDETIMGFACVSDGQSAESCSRRSRRLGYRHAEVRTATAVPVPQPRSRRARRSPRSRMDRRASRSVGHGSGRYSSTRRGAPSISSRRTSPAGRCAPRTI